MTVRVLLGHTSGTDNVGESAELAAKPHEAARRHPLLRNVSSELLGEHRTESQSLEHPHCWLSGAAVLNWTIRSENRTRWPKAMVRTSTLQHQTRSPSEHHPRTHATTT